MLECAKPRLGERVLDVACGTGILTRRLAASAGPGGRVVGVDLNPMMLEVARTVPPPNGAPIEWRQGDGTALELPDRSFDRVYCQQGMQFFPDRAAGAREMRRVLDGAGVAVVATWQGLDRHALFAALADAEEPHLAALGAEITRDELTVPFSLGDGDELRALFADAGFDDVQLIETSIDAQFATPERFVERMEFAYAAVIPEFAENPTGFNEYLEAIARETKDVVEQYRRGEYIVIPMHANVIVAS